VVSTSLLVAPIACDKACRGASGYYIANYMQVADNVHGYFIRAGYGTDDNGIPSFFYETSLPESTFQHVEIFPTAIDAGNPTPAFMELQIYALEGDVLCPQREWLLDFSFSTAYPQSSPGEYFPWHYLPQVACSEFQPDTWVFGQRLLGTSGASAKLAVFTNNSYATTAAGVVDCVRIWCVPDPTKDIFLAHDGILSNTMPPPYVDWTTPPSASKEGGFFYTECCLPLP
jgi:hypothetical protein